MAVHSDGSGTYLGRTLQHESPSDMPATRLPADTPRPRRAVIERNGGGHRLVECRSVSMGATLRAT